MCVGKVHDICVWGWETRDTVCLWRSNDNFVELFLFFHLSVGSRDRTQATCAVDTITYWAIF